MTAEQQQEMKEWMEDWFRRHGVPHFMHRYSAGSQVPDVALLLSIVLAFEIGAAPWLDFGPGGMILAPLILFVLTLIALPWLRMVFQGQPWRRRSGLSLGVRVAALVVASVVFVGSSLPPLVNVTWVSFALFLGVFAAITMLLSRRLWTDADPDHVRRRRILFGALATMVLLFGLEGSVFPSIDMLLWGSALPPGLPALAFLVPLVVFAWHVARGCPDRPAADNANAPAASFQLVAAPMLLLLFGLETALLPYSHPDPVQQGWIELAALVFILLLATTAATVGRRRTLTVSRGALLLTVLAPLFVVAYPSLVWWTGYFELEAFGSARTGFHAFLLSAGINLLYLALVWFVVSFGLDRLAAWMGREALDNLRGVAEGIGQGLPLLLVFMVFLVMQAELWEVVVEVDALEFWLLATAMLLCALGFVVLSARRVVIDERDFDGFHDVSAVVARLERNSGAPLAAAVPAASNGHAPMSKLTPRLKRVKYVNALAVIVVYQLIVLVPIAVVAAVVFWVLGRLAVSTSVAAEWVYGDDAGAREAAALAARAFWEQPWTRVALVLGAFSALYLAVHILSSAEQRKLFFENADRAMRDRLAMRLAYVWLVPFDPRRDGPLHVRARRRRSAEKREPAGEARDSAPRPVHGEA